jgi:hypothetical protein
MKSKALLLLFIFLLNAATGFACALHMSVHEEATEHHHEGDEAAEHHHEEHQHASQLSVHQQKELNGTYITAKDAPCCQGAVNNFNALAKVAPQSKQVILLVPFIYIGTYYQFFLKPVPEGRKSNQLSSLDERRRPPTHSIRIAIQSFQI